MRVVIDLQACQHEGNLTRGIGRYALALTRAMLREAGDDEILIALNGELPASVELIRALLADQLPDDRIRVWKGVPDIAGLDPANDWRRAAAAQVRQAFLEGLAPDVVLVSSLFEGFYDGCITSPAAARPSYETAIVLFDLIPLVNSSHYLIEPRFRDWYLGKVEQLKQAELLLGISEFTCGEAVRELGVPRRDVTNISAAIDPLFRKLEVSAQAVDALRSAHGLRGKFLMYTGGIDHRKNIGGLLQAYARLPEKLRRDCQLAIVCHTNENQVIELRAMIEAVGLAPDEVVLTGYVSDADLLLLYNTCEAFVFPSWHEGFGLPALEAMACGAAVIAAGNTSLPEVMDYADALFDPHDTDAIAAMMKRVLSDHAFRKRLRAHGPERARLFSWQRCGETALQAIRALHQNRKSSGAATQAMRDKPLLAYLSPVPPEHSGVADLSAELLPALAEHYEIEVISDQPQMSDPWMREHLPLRGVAWFRDHADRYDRVVYQLGNGGLHAHMLGLLERIPGTVLLHEIFLSGITRHLGLSGARASYWERSIYESHGYAGLLALKSFPDSETMTERYPCSLPVLRDADGIVVHSRFNAQKADEWYGAGTSRDWSVIPLLRALPPAADKAAARKRLGIGDDEVLVCCFGILGPYKLNHRVLEGWLASQLARSGRSHLVFVGTAHDPAFLQRMHKLIVKSGRKRQVRITEWVERDTYLDYLAAADIAVQLRGSSRGEASYSALDCLAHGLPTIINAHGPMTELPEDAALMIADEFDTAELAAALDRLANDAALRERLAANARAFCGEQLDPRRVAAMYRDAIERHAREGAHRRVQQLTCAIAALDVPPGPDATDLDRLVRAIAANQPRATATRQLLVDISELVRRDAKSGIQRVVRSVLAELLANPPAGFRVEPVYAEPGGKYRYARAFTARFLDLDYPLPPDDPIDTDPGDVFLGLDLVPELPVHAAQLAEMRTRGVRSYFVVHDLLPMSRSDCFPTGAYEGFGNWLSAVIRVADGAMCVSRTVAEDLRRHCDSLQIQRVRPFHIGWFHHGADIASSLPSIGISAQEQAALACVRQAESFLMVGTIEPRKGHAQALAAFELLWEQGNQARLVIIGKSGWMTGVLGERLRNHPEQGKRLFWFNGASDELLSRLYAECSALLLTSEGEGFGLPLIEAAQHGLPILCRDLPVFKEVAGTHATYFSGYEPQHLTTAVKAWLIDHASSCTPGSAGLPRRDWREATRMLLNGVLCGEDLMAWMPGQRLWIPAYDHRLEIGNSERVRDRIVSGGDGMLLRTWPVRLTRGNYRVRIHGDWIDDAGQARLRLLDASHGTVIATLAMRPDKLARQHGELLDDVIEVPHDCVAACFEIDTSEGARLAVLGCAVEPLAHQAAANGVANVNPCNTFQPAETAGVVRERSGDQSHTASTTRQLLVDVSELARRDVRSGVQRVVRAVLGVLLASPPVGFRVEPVRAEPGEPYRYASTLKARFIGEENTQPEEIIETRPGDVFLGLDLAAHEWIAAPEKYQAMRDRGVRVYVVLYDLLPLQRPDCFAHAPYELYEAMLESFARSADGAICISCAVADELKRHFDSTQPRRDELFQLGWFHLGADLAASKPSCGISSEQSAALYALRDKKSFLCVGTVEPRKGYAQTLNAFELLWEKGHFIALVIVGAPGWMTDELMQRIRQHAENGQRLFWFESASDELLMRLYDQCSVLLAPSEGEGFGLPLIEAAQHGLPILCRDIPPFREVAGEHALYFSGYSARVLADALEHWLDLSAQNVIPSSRDMTWLNWKQSTQQLLDVALGNHWSGEWRQGERLWFPVHDPRMQMIAARREHGCAVSDGHGGELLRTWPVALREGTYRTRVQGSWWSESGSARLECLAGSQHTVVLHTRAFEAKGAPGNDVVLDTTLTLKKDYAELSLRILVDSGELAVMGCGIEATPSDDAQRLNDQATVHHNEHNSDGVVASIETARKEKRHQASGGDQTEDSTPTTGSRENTLQ